MAEDMLTIVRSQIERLKKENESLEAERALHARKATACEEAIERNEAKIEALEDVVVAAGRVNRECRKPDEIPASPDNGKAKPKATAAIFALIDQKGPTSREQLLGLADQIDSEADDKRHILQTTVYLLKKRGKLIEDEKGLFDRPRKTAH
jgi:hypothetical protein